MPTTLSDGEMETIRAFVIAAEEFASSDPAMPSHKRTEQEFDRLLEEAKDTLCMSGGRDA